MIVKIHSRGAGSGSGPVDYLLGKARDRDKAVVLRGEPERVRQLIDGCEFARSYTSGVLSFREENLPDDEKVRLMEEFEQTLLPGLDGDQYGVLRRNPRFFRPPKLSPVEQLYAVSAQLTIRGYVAVQRLSGYPQLLA